MDSFIERKLVDKLVNSPLQINENSNINRNSVHFPIVSAQNLSENNATI